jgi:hypothetical protein
MRATMTCMEEIAELAVLLRETEEQHASYEASAPKHDWSDWYAAYISARQDGSSSDDAARDAAMYVESLAGPSA